MVRLKIAGQRFGKLLVLEEVEPIKKHSAWRCICDCGEEKIAVGCEMVRGKLKSCGCGQWKEPTTKAYREHPLYDVWKGMKARCRDKKHIGYKIYGGKGVKVCDEWQKDFFAFYNWAVENGWELRKQIDKDIKARALGVEGNLYSPERCSIVDSKTNARAGKNAKLSMEIAQEIRASSLPTSQLAQKYNTHTSSILNVKNNKTWI